MIKTSINFQYILNINELEMHLIQKFFLEQRIKIRRDMSSIKTNKNPFQ